MPRVNSVLATLNDAVVVHVLEQRAQGVAGRLERGEAGPDDGAEHHPVPGTAFDDLVGDRQDDQRLGPLLDQADGEVGPLTVRQVVRLEQRGQRTPTVPPAMNPMNMTVGGSRSARSRDMAKTTTVDRHHETSEQDDRRDQDRVVRQFRDEQRSQPEEDAHDQTGDPRQVPPRPARGSRSHPFSHEGELAERNCRTHRPIVDEPPTRSEASV